MPKKNGDREEKSERKILEHILHELREIKHFLKAAKGFEIKQIIGGHMGAILGITKGNVGHFTSVTVPAGGALQAGTTPKWASDDPNVTLTPSADGFSVDAQTSATDTATSFNLTESGVASDGTAISTVNNVPLNAPVVPATGFDVTQTSYVSPEAQPSGPAAYPSRRASFPQGVPVRITLQRQIENSVCTMGEMTIGGAFAAWTLERQGPQFPADFHRVEAGVFPIQIYNSPHFGRPMPLLIDPPHEWIEIHYGNFPRNSHGCVLVGTQRGDNMIYNTREMFDKLFPIIQAAVNTEGCDIEILDVTA